MNVKPNLLSLASGMLVGLVLILYMVTFTVGENEYALKFTFGKPSSPIEEPGLKFKWPWPVEKVVKLDRSIHIFDGTFDQTYTADQLNVIVLGYVCWRITDPMNYWMSEAKGVRSQAEVLLKDLVHSMKNGVFGKHPLTHLISTDPEEIKFEEIEDEIRTAVNAQAQKYGMEVIQFGIKRLALPESTLRTVFEHMRAKREGIARTIVNDGKKEAEVIRAKAEEEAGNILAEAQRVAQVTRAEGDAESAKSYEKLRRNPALAKFLNECQSLVTITEGSQATFIMTTDMPAISILEKGLPELDAKEPE